MNVVTSRLRRFLPLAGCLPAALWLAGCQTPDLKPFAAASAAAVASINQGGDLALSPLAELPVLLHGKLVEPKSPDHPARRLATEWESRRKASDAILVYTASLAAINDAVANRKANVSALIESVRTLTAAVPVASLGGAAATNVVNATVSAALEARAWRNMADAVKGADPAIQVVADIIKKDLAALALLHEGLHQNQILATESAEDWEGLNRLHATLLSQQKAKRAAVQNNPVDANVGADLARIDALLAGVERDLNPRRAAIATHETGIASGRRFYAGAAGTIEAWAAAHHDLIEAFAQRRSPNISLLIARAQELNGLLQELKSSHRSTPSP